MIIAVDTETTGTDFWHGCQAFMVQICDGESNYYWTGKVNPKDRSDVRWDEKDLDEIQGYLDSADRIVYHNAKFDVRALSLMGLDAELWDKIDDTIIMSHLVCSGESHALKYLAAKYLDYYNEEEKTLASQVKKARLEHKDWDIAKEGHKCFPALSSTTKRVSWWKMDYWLCPEECAEYGMADVEMTLLLYNMFTEVIEFNNKEEQYETRRQLLEPLYNMEDAGIHMYSTGVNGVEQIISESETIKTMLHKRIMKECHIQINIDLNNQEHQRFLLFEVLNLPIQFRSEKTQQPSVKREALESYIRQNPNNATVQHFNDYRQLDAEISKLKSYQKWRCPDGRIRSNMVITGTRETRQASWDPNVQNIKKSLRNIFGPEPGYVWLDYDLVNIEMRIWVYQVKNPELMKIFDEGGSVHMLIASILHPELIDKCNEEGLEFKKEYKESWYQWVKNGNFAIIYGAGKSKADLTYRKEGSYNDVVSRFPEVPVYTASVIQEVLDNEARCGTPYLTCLGGYPLEVNIEDLYTTACNYKAQGSAGYVINHAMINVQNNPLYQSANAKMINQVHDSIVIEVPWDSNTQELRSSLQKSIEDAGRKFLPTCEAEYDTLINPMDIP